MCDCRRKTIQVFAADLHEEVQVQGRPLEAHQALPSWPHAAPDARAVARRRIEERFQRQGSLLVVGCLQQLVDVVGVVIPFFDLHQHLGAPADRQQVLPAAPASTSAETDRVVRIPGQAGSHHHVRHGHCDHGRQSLLKRHWRGRQTHPGDRVDQSPRRQNVHRGQDTRGDHGPSRSSSRR